jgi:hypothetical protein
MGIKERLEYLRGELRAERISYGELAELQGLAQHIEPGDVELLEAAGVPETDEDCPWGFISLQQDEDQGTAECGCKLVRRGQDEENPAVFLCPLHSAAPDMRAVLERVQEFNHEDSCPHGDPADGLEPADPDNCLNCAVNVVLFKAKVAKS